MATKRGGKPEDEGRIEANVPLALKAAAMSFYKSRGYTLTCKIVQFLESDLKANGIDPYARDESPNDYAPNIIQMAGAMEPRW